MILETTTRQFLDRLAAEENPPIHTLSPQEAREVLRQAQAGPIAKRPVDRQERTIAGGPTGSVRVSITRPHGARQALPAVIYFHGGGWILGDAETHDRLVGEIACGAEAAVVFVDYDRSPEARYPAALEQGYAALRYVAEEGDKLGLDAARLAVMGDSAGGNLATAVAMLAAERKGPEIALQALFYPVTDAGLDTGSYEEFQDGPWLTRPAMEWFWDAYQPDRSAREDALVSPLRAARERLRGLPAALVITAEADVLRDEGETYAAKLIEAGVAVTAVRYLATIHDFVMLDALADTPAARGAIAQATAALRKAFGTSRD